MESPLLNNLKGKNYKDRFILEEDIDGLTGATYTTRAVVECTKSASRKLAVQKN